MELRTTKNNLEDDVRKLTFLYEMYASSFIEIPPVLENPLHKVLGNIQNTVILQREKTHQ